MRTMMMGVALLIAGPASAGDVWFSMDVADADGRLHLELPAVARAAVDEVRIERGGQTVAWKDLVAEVQAAPEGTRTSCTAVTDDGERLPMVLEHRAVKEGAVSMVDLTLGEGLSMSVPLEEGMGMLSMKDGSTSIQLEAPVDGLDVSGDEVLAVVRRAGPTTLVKVSDGQGNGLTLRVR